MDAKVDNQEDGGSKMKEPESWKLPKIPVDQVYKKKALRLFPSYAIKDFQKIIALDSSYQNVRSSSFQLADWDFLKSFMKKKHKFLHLGLVQVAIKPLTMDGLGAPIIVCLKDGRQRDLKNSCLAMVATDLSKGPFYFNCFPSFSVASSDAYYENVLILDVHTSGIPIAIKYRIVCKAMVDLNSEALQELTLGKTVYFHANSESPNTTNWDEAQVEKETRK